MFRRLFLILVIALCSAPIFAQDPPPSDFTDYDQCLAIAGNERDEATYYFGQAEMKKCYIDEIQVQITNKLTELSQNGVDVSSYQSRFDAANGIYTNDMLIYNAADEALEDGLNNYDAMQTSYLYWRDHYNAAVQDFNDSEALSIQVIQYFDDDYELFNDLYCELMAL